MQNVINMIFTKTLKIKTFFLAPAFFLVLGCNSVPVPAQKITVGAEQTEKYLPLLEGKKVALVGNQSSLVGTTHLLDTLIRSGISVAAIFCPEHGFRGQAEAGARINDGTDPQTGIPIISLFGANKKPQSKQLKGIDIVVFDIQDVGARFYTYISTLHYVMEACAENGVPLLVLDRPNPNGFYVDGPVLDTAYRSFVGMHPVPIVHGMTIGEYAQMINGEKWLKNGVQCDLSVIKMLNYTHDSLYHLPIAPSPNLQTDNAILLYPSLCCFEGTTVSVGRGTPTPFEIIGSPTYSDKSFSFVPKPIKGVSNNPLHNGKTCYGMDLQKAGAEIVKTKRLNLGYLLTMYKKCDKNTFFLKNNFFDKLMGNNELRKQVKQGLSEKQIRESWEPALSEYKKMREKYLLYE